MNASAPSAIRADSAAHRGVAMENPNSAAPMPGSTWIQASIIIAGAHIGPALLLDPSGLYVTPQGPHPIEDAILAEDLAIWENASLETLRGTLASLEGEQDA
jgi:hypothetical protein